MMGISAGPDMVQDGLVLSLNANDRLIYISGSTTWNDVSGRGNNGTLTNGPTFNLGNGGSIVFDGVDDYVLHPSLDLGTTCSWGLWINYDRANNSNEAFVVLGANINNRYNLFYNFPDKTFYIGYGSNNFGSFSYNAGLNANTWYNITHVREGNITTIYLNGSSIGIITKVSSVSSVFSVIGTETTNTYFSNMRLSSTHYYNRALSAQEVLQNYNATKSRFGII